MNFAQFKRSGHWPTLLTSFLYFDVSFMVWTLLGALGVHIGTSLGLSPQQKGLMVAVPYLSGAFIRILLGLLVDRIGAKQLAEEANRDNTSPPVTPEKMIERYFVKHAKVQMNAGSSYGFGGAGRLKRAASIATFV